jgi:galactoside O-acetyltransferase
MKDVVIHETAIIKRPKLVKMGSHVAIDPFFYITTQAKIGSWVHIGSHVSVIGGKKSKLIVEDYVAISSDCHLICASDDFNSSGIAVPFVDKKLRTKVYGKQIKIEKFAILGTGCIVMPDVTIGKGSAIGAGSVVTRDTLPWGIYVGSPARFTKYREEIDDSTN